MFLNNRVYDTDLSCESFHQNSGGLSPKEVEERERHYGLNLIKITVLPVYRLIIKEVRKLFVILVVGSLLIRLF